MRPLTRRLALLLGSTLVFFGAAELLYRQLGPSPTRGDLFYADAEHHEVDFKTADGLARAQAVVEEIPDAPRFRITFKPGVLIYLCYRGYENQGGFDEHGCVPFRINSWGVREREELCSPKPPGQTRVICLGDSTTVGWGVRAENSWPRLAEGILRGTDDDLRMVNCGASGTLLPDEYAHGLVTRFARFEPDAVLVTLCVNDLLPVNGGMAHYDPAARAAMGAGVPAVLAWSRIASDAIRAARQGSALTLDPSHDWVAELLALDLKDYPDDAKQVGGIYWSSGVPQTALRTIRDWCRERGIRFGVAIWPFLQQLENRDGYPFSGMHDRVGVFCRDEDIPFLDLLDAFLGRRARELWVTPRDMHGNATAHALAAPRIARFVEELLGS